MSIAEKIKTIAENELKVYEAGKKAQYDEFWDSYQNYGQQKDYSSSFFGSGWNDTTYNPKYPIVTREGNSGSNMFAWSEITDTKVTIDISKSVVGSLFSNAKKLITIRKLLIAENSTFGSTFTNCYELENLTIEGIIGNAIDLQWSTKLSKASITNIIDALSTTTSGLTATFSKTAVETAFSGTTSTEWLALVATKSNWNISLV